MLSIVRPRPEFVLHLLQSDPLSFYLRPVFNNEMLEALEQDPLAHCILANGAPIFLGGIKVYWENRGEVWAMVSPDSGKHFVGIHRITVDFLNACPLRRIEAAVEIDFAPGHRWIQMLGFEKEAERVRAYSMDGKDYSLYSRVKY